MTNAKKWTAEQWQAITRTDTDLIVTASAGSGKTSAMIERALSLVTAGTPVTGITMLTFTEAAADEMKDKMRARLMSAAKEAVDDKRDFYVSQIDELPYASISTIHGYCAALVREFFEQIPLSPTVRILEEDAVGDLKQKAFDALVKEKEGDHDFDEMRLMVGLRDDRALFELLDGVYEYMTNQPDRTAWLDKMYRDTYDVPFESTVTATGFVEGVRNAAKEVLQGLHAIAVYMDEEDKAHKALLILEERAHLFADVVSVRDVITAYRLLEEDNRSLRTNKSDFATDVVALKEAFVYGVAGPAKEICGLGTYDELVSMHRSVAPFVRMLCRLVLRYQDLYTKQKTDVGGVDFADLERYAVKILSDDAIAEEVRSRNAYVFVDEFQDTNLVQSAIIARITPPERLFVVGDSKQCIYRFREAEPQIFLNTLHRLSAEDKAVTFGHNFRSDNGILRFVNKVFARLMTPDFGGVDYAATDKFILRPEAEDSGDKAVDVYLYDRDTSPKLTAEGVFSVMQSDYAAVDEGDKEGLAIAQYVATHLGQDVVVKGERKTLDYGDFAILYARRTAATRCIRTLISLGVPLNLDTFAGEVGLRDVNLLLTYANLMDNPMQDYPLLTVLHSPFGGFSDADLATVRLSGDKYTPFHQEFARFAQGEGELAHRAAHFLERLARHAFAASFTPLPTLFRDVVLSTGYADYLFAQEDGLERYAALNGFIAEVEGKSYAYDLSTFCTHFRHFPVDKLVSITEGNARRRVVVSTMHASKGLEYPVVILPALDARNSSGGAKKPAVSMDKDLGLGTEYYDRDTRTKRTTFAQKVIDMQKKAKETEDRLRLLYVAMTRAQCRLFLLGGKMVGDTNLPKATDNFSAWLKFAMSRDASLARHVWAFDETRRFRVEAERTTVRLDDGLDEVLSARYPYADAVAVGKKYTVTALNARDTDEDVQLGSFLHEEEEATRGTLYHTVFQHVDYRATDADKVTAELARLVEEGYVTAEESASIDPAVVARCLALPVLQRTLMADVRPLHEQRFVLSVSAAELGLGSAEPVLVQGVIDLLIVGDCLTLVDFKSSHRTPRALQAAYKVQLSLYCQAVAKALHRSVDECYLVEINRALAIPMPV